MVERAWRLIHCGGERLRRVSKCWPRRDRVFGEILREGGDEQVEEVETKLRYMLKLKKRAFLSSTRTLADDAIQTLARILR